MAPARRCDRVRSAQHAQTTAARYLRIALAPVRSMGVARAGSCLGRGLLRGGARRGRHRDRATIRSCSSCSGRRSPTGPRPPVRLCVRSRTARGASCSASSARRSGGARELPASVEVHRSIPQLDVLSKADAFVSHGAWAARWRHFSHGVPIVAVPEISEQRVVARQLETLGIGSGHPLDQVTADVLRARVDGLAQVAGWPRCNASSMRPAERAQPRTSSKASRAESADRERAAASGQRCLARASKQVSNLG